MQVYLVSLVRQINERFSLGKPNEVLESTEFRRSMSNLSTETTAVATTQSSTTDLDEQIIQAENALQTEAEERCTGKYDRSLTDVTFSSLKER